MNTKLFHLISAVFRLPDELILLILSYISPDPRFSGHCARFRIPYSLGIIGCHDQRVEFLRPLSMTCRAMWLRLLPWVWERLEIPPGQLLLVSKKQAVQRLNTILNSPHTLGAILATNVKCFDPLLRPWIGADFVFFGEGSRRYTDTSLSGSSNV